MTDRIQPVIGIIGGSGLYDIDGLEGKEWRRVESPWGEPSDELLFGVLAGVRCVFLPRHGRGHKLSPSHLNYRANIDALKRAGVTDVLSLSWISLSTAASRARKVFLATAAWRMFPWRTRYARGWATRWRVRFVDWICR
jgi:hypothetical protein